MPDKVQASFVSIQHIHLSTHKGMRMPEDPRILELREKRKQSRLGGGEKRIEKQHAKGKLTARERIDLLLDPGTFHELEPFVTSRKHDLELDEEKLLGDGVVTGYGQIEGRTIYVYAQDFTVSGGSLGEMQGQKISHVMDLAAKNGTPVTRHHGLRRRPHSGRHLQPGRIC